MLMHKFVLIFALVFTCSSAMAEWTKVVSNEESTTYADVSTINKVGDIAKMSDLTDINKPSVGLNYASFKTSHEYDCVSKKSRIVAFSRHSGSMGSGNIISSDTRLHDWLQVRVGGETESLWEVACSKH
jgi:hypothetical protein